jgi:mitogen-activated protein kinase kinase
MGRGGAMNPDIAAKLRAFHMTRQGAPPPGRGAPTTPGVQTPGVGGPSLQGPSPTGPQHPGGIPANFRMPPGRPTPPSFVSSPNMVAGRSPSLAEKRGLKMPGGLPGAPPAPGSAAGARQKPKMTLSSMAGSGVNGDSGPPKQESAMDRYAEYIDKETGSLKFKDKAVLNSKGVQFSSGQSFQISLDEVDTIDELGKGNYGTVYKVRHSRPQMRKVGQGLAGNKSASSETRVDTAAPRGNTTGIVMAMKEMRLELEDSKFATIIMELDVLHRCASPFIVDFYGAFFQEGAVYICMEFMDGGSMDKLYGDGVPEGVLRKVTLATTRGLKSLKDEHNIIHRDVKPTNILINTAGAIKICDFGVSGNLVASIAKTNIGCQSYMAPERISSGGVAQAGANPGGGTYSVQSDIWSLGLTIIECAMGRYPYPPETYDNIFSQLSVSLESLICLFNRTNTSSNRLSSTASPQIFQLASLVMLRATLSLDV